uniref:Laminin subunit alpha-1 n=1 Tax=Cynoglossus semilaevis TaxID=244447 RepID=A0A3P8WGE8_CYNSE
QEEAGMKLLLLLLLLEQAVAQQRGLFPAILNLASNADISSNATCGDPEPEVYCKLVDHVPGRKIKNPHCPKCDANSSPSIKNGRQFHWITITLDLKQIFQIAYIIIKAANSPRPGNWILERSLDGATFYPWQFYAISDTECLSRYNITPRLGPPTYKRDTEVICTSYYSKLNPLEHGEIHTSLINGRPGADDLTPDLLNFTSARYIRLRLQRIRTLNADLMTLSSRDPREIDPIVSRRYYYSVKDISVGGMCICYGHAKSCPLDPVTKKLQCVCEHNTCGESCNQCCPGYHQQPWQPGTLTEGNTCEKCNCHNKATDCYFNQTVADLSLSLNSRGSYHGGGVCLNCQQNTDGINCESCRDGYYRPAQVSPYSDYPCVECNCNPKGSESSVCVKDDKQQPGVSAGKCVCREGFAGQQCDRCAFGYRDFPQCAKCECNLSGSINNDPCAPCICKANVMGAHCDLCKPGFYNLQNDNLLGCTECFCFGVSDVCESSHWSTASVHYKDAWLSPATDYDKPAIHDNNLLIPANVSFGHTHGQMLSWAAPASFLRNKLMSYGGYLNYSVVYDAPMDNIDRSLPALSDIIIEGNERALRTSTRPVLHLSPLAESAVVVKIVPAQLVDNLTNAVVTRDDLLSVLTNVVSLKVRVHINASADGPIRLSSVSLTIADAASVSGAPAVAAEMCECPWGYSGTSCEACLPDFYRVGGVMFGGNCMQCECNDHAKQCDIYGVCVVSFSPTCVLEASGQVTCDQCQVGYTGVNCERCATGYYGNPQVVGGVCVPCDCNGNVDVSEFGHCDAITGECLLCLGNTTGRHCEICQPGYYGDAIQAKDCRECGCDVSGALSSHCDLTTGKCSCREKVTGRACDTCLPGFFGLQKSGGCSACNCSQSGSVSKTCDEDGRCQCVEGVGGDRCDRCSRGYYGFHGSGCTACTCEHTGGNCDPESGECICPAHTEGDRCERCETGYWGHDLIHGCEPCSCSIAGSSGPNCNVTTGQCQCIQGFSGRICDQCAPGYHGYPACLTCGCDVAGTEERFCNTTLGLCDCKPTGVCACKVTLHCDECKSGWFGLSTANPNGCSQCFCSGLSRDCEEKGGLRREQVSLGHSPALLSLVSQSNLRGVVSGVYQQSGDMLLDTRQVNMSTLTGPVYWKLPPQFEGDQLMSYGGHLSYNVTFYAEDGSGLSNQEPQVLIRGGTLRKHAIYTDMVAPPNGVTTQHYIKMHKWKYFNSVSEKAVSRDDFMSVLSSIQYIIIKASYGTKLQQSRISNITMETAVESEPEELAYRMRDAVRLIESCSCPPGYSGLSCQECAPGYFRQSQSELSSQSRKSMVVTPCIPCQCNNHSTSCDKESGECLDCQHHTSGHRCESCALGYYGKVRGSISDCSLCGCPLRDNSFSSTCVLDGAFGDYRCTACQRGYEGRYCERCSLGYYGNPSKPGGQCFPCSCSEWGSVQPLCDQLSGQCECKAGVKGQLCEHCDERHVLEEGECVSCNDACTGLLLDDLDKLHNIFLTVNVSAIVMAPYGQMVALENQTRGLQMEMEHLNQTKGEIHTSKQRHMLEELEVLLETMSDVNLTVGNALAAGQELAESLLHLLESDFVSVREAFDTKLLALSRMLATNTERLNNVYSLLNNAAQNNTQTHDVLERMHALLQDYEVNARIHAKTYIQNLNGTYISLLSTDLDQWRPLLRKKVDGLVIGLKETDGLENIYRAESHAHMLENQVYAMRSSLSAVFNLSRNGSQLVQLGGDVSQQVDAAEQEASSALTSASVALNVVVTSITSIVARNNSAVKSKLEEAEHRTEHLMKQIKPLSMMGEKLSRNLSDIRELIDQARKQAASIKVAMQADKDCVRSYRPQIESSNVNSLSLILKTTSRENLLFYLGRNSTGDYLAAEMHDGKVSVLWDLGSGSSRVEFPGLDIANNKWTRINATRYGVKVSLSVHQLESKTPPLPAVTGTSPGTSQTLDMDRDSVIYVGGLGTRNQVTSTTFQGCLGEVSLNEKNIGLWNYDSREGKCGGCFSSPQMEETAFHFDGSGYSVVHKSLRATSTSIVLLFKTLSPGGLLLYLASNNTRDFLSIELVEGHVRLNFDLGSGVLTLTSNRKYNRNTWYKITLQRNKRKGYMSIMAADQSSEKEVLEAESPGTASDLNRSDLDPIYIGGLPASRPARRQLVSRSFVGCIKNVEISRSNFDLLRDAYGVRKGCVVKAVRSVSHLNGGFVQIPALVSGLEAELLFSFTSNNHSGILLAALSSDGKMNHKNYKNKCAAPLRQEQANKHTHTTYDTYATHEILSEAVFSSSSRLIDLSGAVRYEGVKFDSCLLQESEGAVLPDTQDLEPTLDPDPAHLSVATPTHLTQFALSKHSHMTFIIDPNTVRKSVSIRLSVRSRGSNGAILTLTDSKHMDFVVIRLTAGKLMMSADLGRGPASVTSSVAVNDGEWHNVRAHHITHKRTHVNIISVTIKGNQLDVDDRLYLGGLPHTLTSRRLNVSSSLPGCLRSVSLNGATLDLTRPASKQDTTSCFSRDQTGSHFNGSGYAVLMHDGYKVGSDLTITLEFRSSQLDAVFVGISSAKVDAIGLEMINGQVVFNVNNGAGRVSVRSNGQLLCDGRWHVLQARKTKHSLSLSVDGRSYTTANPYPQSTSAETNNPVYLGGFPVDVRQNCLSISSRFRGCLRNLQLVRSHMSNTLDLSSAHFLLGVTPYSCPAT